MRRALLLLLVLAAAVCGVVWRKRRYFTMTTTEPAFRTERRHVADTKLAEVITGAFAIAYGIQAVQPGLSQWKMLLTLSGGAWVWGGSMIFAGALAVLFAYTHFYWARLVIALLLLIIWAAVVVLFSQAEIAGPPMFNGLILMAVAVRVMIGSARHEKQHTQTSA